MLRPASAIIREAVEPEATYQRFWRRALPALGRNAVDPESPPALGDARWGVSVLLRFSSASPTGRRLATAAQQIGVAAGDHHLVHGPELLHTTVRSIEGFRGAVADDDEAVKRYVDVLQEEARDLESVAIRYAGVAPTVSGVLAQGWPLDQTLHVLRERLHARLPSNVPVAGPETQRPRDLAHATLLAFTGPLADPAATVAAIEAHRHTEFGVEHFRRLDLVCFERGASDARIVPLRQLTFGA